MGTATLEVLSRARGKANLKQILWHDAVLENREEKTTLVSLRIPLKSRITSLSCNFQPMFVFYNLTVLFPNVYILVWDPWWPCAQKCYPHCPSLQQTWDDPPLSHSLCQDILGAPPKDIIPKELLSRESRIPQSCIGLSHLHPISLEMFHVTYSRIKLLVDGYSKTNRDLPIPLPFHPTKPLSPGGMNVS